MKRLTALLLLAAVLLCGCGEKGLPLRVVLFSYQVLYRERSAYLLYISTSLTRWS